MLLAKRVEPIYIKAMRLQDCPVTATIDVIGGKWKPLILNELKAGPRHFGALQKRIEGASHKVLTEQLRQLEADGIVQRRKIDGPVHRTEYSLSEYGTSLRPILNAMSDWGKRFRARASH